jgi:tetratricopeptide (TPR) repeat protein
MTGTNALPAPASLTLVFIWDHDGYRLIETVFMHRELALRGLPPQRARPGLNGFPWRRGVMATVVFFLRWAALGLRRRSDPQAAEPEFKGKRGSQAASFDDVLSKNPDWAKEVFGFQGGVCLLGDLVERWNPGFSTIRNGDVMAFLNTAALPPERIRVVLDGHEVDDPAMIDTIADDVANQFGRDDRPADPPGGARQAQNVPYPPNLCFTGRSGALQQMGRALPAAEPAGLAITGLGGVGKTQLAAEYVRRFAERYTHVLWVRAGAPDVIAAEFAGLASLLRLPQADDREQLVRSDAVREWLRARGGWLLVFDGAPSPKVLADYVPMPFRGHVLVTSRNANWGNMAVRLALSPFDRADSVAFLQKRLEMTDGLALTGLAEALGDLPLGLEQAAAYIKEVGLSPAAYLELFRRRHLDLWQHDHLPPFYEHTIATTWSLALQQVQRESPEAADLMRLCAHLGSGTIPRALLVRGRGRLPSPLREALGDPSRTNDALGALRRYSLVEATAEALSMHRLVQTVARDSLAGRARRTWARAALRLVCESFPYHSQDEPTWPAAQPVLPHALAALEHAEARGGLEPEEAFPIRLFQAVCRDVDGDHRSAVDICRSLRELIRGSRPELYATASVHLATFLDHKGPDDDRRAALRVLEELLRHAPGAKRNRYGVKAWWALYQKGVLLRRLGRLDEACAVLEQVYAGPVSPDLKTSSCHQLGVIDLKKRRYKEAQAKFEACLRDWGDDPTNHRRVYEFRRLGEVYALQGDVEKARQAFGKGVVLARALRFTRYVKEIAQDMESYGLGRPDDEGMA